MSTPLHAWLADRGLGQHAERLVAEDIDLQLLPHLGEQDLEKLGFNLGQRKRLMLAIASLRDPAPAGPDAAPGTAAVPAAANPAAPLPRQPERRRLTVMFCDIVGSSALSERMDPEDLRNLMQAYQRACGAVIREADGHVAQYLGDGLMVYFGWPRAREDAASRAVRASLAIIERVKHVHPAAALRVRVGIATGPVVVGETGEGDASVPKAAVGPTPNLAARLQALAGPDQVVIAPATRELLGQSCEYEDLGEQILKGFSNPVRAWAVLHERGEMSRFDARRGADHLSTPLIGRSRELAVLRERWARAVDGAGQVVLLSGEPGLGKSHLLHALREDIGPTAHGLVRFECSPQYRNSSLYPVTEHLGRAAGFLRGEDPVARRERLDALLSRHDLRDPVSHALLAQLLQLPPENPALLAGMTPQYQHQKTFQSLEDLLAASAAQRPLLLVLEDAHWADPTTVEFMRRIIERMAAWRGLGVITYRPSFAAPWPAHAHVAGLPLARLTREETLRLVTEIAAHKVLPPSVVEHIATKTDGVPLYVEAFTKTLLTDSALRDDGDRLRLDGTLPRYVLPDSLHDSLMERLDQLGHVRDVAQSGAAIGREFDFEFLQAASGRDEPYLRDALAQLIEAGLLEERPEALVETYAFRHALLQDAAYSTLLRDARQILHQRIVRFLETHRTETRSRRPELLAHHCAEAGDRASALAYARSAGLMALMQSSFAEAIAHARQGLGWLAAITDEQARLHAELGLNDLLLPALMASVGYASPEVEAVTNRSLDLLDQLGDEPSSATTLWALEAFHHVRSERAQALELALRFVNLATRAGDTSLQVAGLPILAQCLWIEGDVPAARRALEEAIPRYDPVAHRHHAHVFGLDSLAYCLMTLSQVCRAEGDGLAAVRHAEEAVRHARALGHANTIGLALLFELMVHQQAGDRARVLALGAAAIEFCEQFGVVTPTSYARLIYNWACGAVDESLGILAMHRQIRAELGSSYYGGITAEAMLEAGRVEEARALLETCIAFGETRQERYHLPSLRATLARLAVSAPA